VAFFSKAAAIDSTGRYDRVCFTAADGTSQEMTGSEFEKLAFHDRIKILLNGHPRFSLNGRDLPAREALKWKK